MDRKVRAQVLVLAIVLVCATAVGGVIWYRSRPIDIAAQFKRIPSRNAVVLFVNFAELRSAGLLQLLSASKTAEDPDYRKFVTDTGFDYLQDLDTAMVALAPTGNYMLVGGRFDWTKLQNYARKNGGTCVTTTCEMDGSTPRRKISFFPVQRSLMALAVSPESLAVNRLLGTGSGPRPEVSSAPVWVTMNGSVLKSGSEMPAGTRMFARTIEEAENLRIELTPDGSRLAAKLDVRCRDAASASRIAAELNRITGMLKEMIARENQSPNPADLSGVLTSGTFRTEGLHVYGYWPIERSFVENVLSGGLG